MSYSQDIPVYAGQCLCGAIRYEVTQIRTQMAHCHCSMCRKFHGAAFGTYGVARVENFRWLEGVEFLKTYTASNGTQRKFCMQCGSSMIFVSANDPGEVIDFTLGTLDSEIVLRPDAHIYTDSKADWHEIHDGLIQYPSERK